MMWRISVNIILLFQMESTSDARNTSAKQDVLPVCAIVLGMAGSGKTTFVKQLIAHLESQNKHVYSINLDPAVHIVPYRTNIDIRDTVKFKEVMKQYGFGPNGAIMTSLNFFSSQFNKVVDLINKNAEKVSYVVLDTPGQIEVFTWSASGTIISESLGSVFPTIVIYVMDTPRSYNPVTFMSNMLYACSVLYRLQLPFLVVLNKTDIIDCTFAIEWMRDFEAFQDALAAHRSADGPSELESDSCTAHPETSPYMTSLMNSMSLVLDEFYSGLRCCGVSSVTGEGMDELVKKIAEAKSEYFETYVPMLQSRQLRVSKMEAAGSAELAHVCSDECAHNEAETTAKLAMGPLGPHKPKRAKTRRRKQQLMLVDMAGDYDEADQDAMADLDGVEQRDSSDETEEENETKTDPFDEKFRRLCSVSSRGADQKPDQSDVKP
ncbi:XPA binding protein 1 GTPase [Fasciola hepatica]|uniref:GPN-loop GTPase n=1 Tax=Fasciola hepatica TaxID=6192 RepID=A0A2H1BYW2_FASHE|nr:XPA binding protein 1 GTPase [Fasciola hepatica]